MSTGVTKEPAVASAKQKPRTHSGNAAKTQRTPTRAAGRTASNRGGSTRGNNVRSGTSRRLLDTVQSTGAGHAPLTAPRSPAHGRAVSRGSRAPAQPPAAQSCRARLMLWALQSASCLSRPQRHHRQPLQLAQMLEAAEAAAGTRHQTQAQLQLFGATRAGNPGPLRAATHTRKSGNNDSISSQKTGPGASASLVTTTRLVDSGRTTHTHAGGVVFAATLDVCIGEEAPACQAAVRAGGTRD